MTAAGDAWQWDRQLHTLDRMSTQARFATTRWSLVVSAGEGGHADARSSRLEVGRLALSELCRLYWPPLYAFLRRSGSSRADAEDLVQGFLADLLSRGDVARADRDRGRFRTFLLSSLKNFASKQRERAAAQKRGGHLQHLSLERPFSFDFEAAERAYRFEPSDRRTPEAVFERQYALALLGRVLEDLGQSEREAGRGDWFASLKPLLTTGGADAGLSYVDVAATLGTTPGAVKTAASRLRRRYREALDRALADGLEETANLEADLAAERAALVAALAVAPSRSV